MADSISWRRFCRIGIGGRVPHPTTLMKITTRCGVTAVAQLNEVLLAKATQAKLLAAGRPAAAGHGRTRRHPDPDRDRGGADPVQAGHLKRRSGWDLSLLDGVHGARTWCGHGILTHNLTKIAAVAA